MSVDWPFDQPPDCVAITLNKIVAGSAPILHVSHDAEDHGWQFLDGSASLDPREAAVVAMAEVAEMDPSVLDVADLPPGWIARRASVDAPWQRSRK